MYNSDMEFANQKDGSETAEKHNARQRDRCARDYRFMRLRFTHLHVDWHYPVDWLGSPGFVVQEATAQTDGASSLTRRLFGANTQLRACLAVTADPLPAAWVRIAALQDERDALPLLQTLLAQAELNLRQQAVSEIAWMPLDEWPQAWFEGLGFEIFNRIETFVKEDMSLPLERKTPGLVIRPLQLNDLPHLAAIETAAFDPIWRHSEVALRLASRQSVNFDVAELEGRIVGFQFSTRGQASAHLARITIAPDFQGRGIGGALLAHALKDFWRRGLRKVSLNTQADNMPSRQLYRRFGFKIAGIHTLVWRKEL